MSYRYFVVCTNKQGRQDSSAGYQTNDLNGASENAAFTAKTSKRVKRCCVYSTTHGGRKLSCFGKKGTRVKR